MEKKFFVRRIGKYLITMLIPLILLFAAFGSLNIKNVNKELRREGKQTVNAVKTNLELVLSNVLYQNELLTGMTRVNLSLEHLLKQQDLSYGDAVNISALRAMLSSIKNTHEYIDSIYIFIEEADAFFSSEQGLNLIANSDDTDWIRHYQQMQEKQNSDFKVRQLKPGTPGEKKVLSVYKRLLLQKGCILVNIDANKFEEFLNTQVSDENETVLILNENGEVLAQNTENSIEEEFFQDFMEQNQENWEKVFLNRQKKWQKTEHGIWFFNMDRYEEMNLILISAISRDAWMKNIEDLLKIFLLFFAVDFCVTVSLAYITTRRSFSQIAYMIDVFNEAEQGIKVQRPKKQNKDEYDMIMNNIIYLFLNTNYLNNELRENEYKRVQAEMMALQLQINPHFLFNTLQTVDLEIRSGKSNRTEIGGIVRSLSDILKYALVDPENPVQVKEEISYLKRYVEIQKFRFGDCFIIYYDVDEDVEDAKVFRLFLQPLVENSFLHGIRDLDRRGYIRVSLQRRNDKIRCCVTDTGKGMDKAELRLLYQKIYSEKSEGIGLTNLYRRLVLRYGEDISFKIRSKKGWGTDISFQIPYEKM